MSHPCFLYVPAPSLEVGRSLAHGLIEARVAACVNIIPEIQSVYWWENAVEESREVVLLIKTVRSRQEEVIAFLRAHHPYACPVILPLAVEKVPSFVLNWLQDALKKNP